MIVNFIGPFPSPYHGQSLVTSRIHEEFIANGFETRISNTNATSTMAKLAQHIRAIIAIISVRSACYISVNSNRGIYLSAVLATVARLCGCRIILHHHAYANVRVRTFPMVVLSSLAGPCAIHIVLGEKMADDLRREVPEAATIAVLNNAGFVSENGSYSQPDAREGDVVFGHISNLTEEKGIGRAVDCGIARSALDPATRLVVAGPCRDTVSVEAVEKAKSRLGDHFVYLGRVDEAEKRDFLSSIDIMLFPSLYKNEAEPMVVLEALANGVPVIAYDIGCIADDLGDTGGVVVPVDDDFIAAVNTYMQSWDRKSFAEKSRARFEEILALHKVQFKELCKLLRNG